MRASALLPLLTIVAPALAQSAGQVTRVASATDFDVEGYRVVLAPGVLPEATPTGAAPYVGQRAQLWTKSAGNGDLIATRVVLLQPPAHKVSGTGLIDSLEPAPEGVYRFRADGRRLELQDAVFTAPVGANGKPASAAARAAEPQATAADIRLNVWVSYSGTEQPDGMVAVDHADFTGNAVSKGEGRMLKKQEWDPAAVDPNAHQSATSRFFKGTDPKQIPPYPDPDGQARIERIGTSLVPRFQRDLPDDDPVKIHFRFQLVDEPKWGDAATSSTGIILVPYQIADRLHDDSQLAAVLADNIAAALEKQVYRQRNEATAAGVASAATTGAEALVPGLGIAASLASSSASQHYLSRARMEQSGRVALGLMHDAGYDMRQAPEAWWILASRADADPHRKPPPARARNQFNALGETWQAASAQPLPVTSAAPQPSGATDTAGAKQP